ERFGRHAGQRRERHREHRHDRLDGGGDAAHYRLTSTGPAKAGLHRTGVAGARPLSTRKVRTFVSRSTMRVTDASIGRRKTIGNTPITIEIAQSGIADAHSWGRRSGSVAF